MGCRKITYNQAKDTNPFLGVWKGEALEKSSFLKGGCLAKKEAALKNRDSYYPFGLSINALSSRAPLSKPNKYNTFHGQERVEDFDLGWIQFRFRNYDPTIGRFFNLDPLADKYYYNSPYAFAENKLGLGIELEGAELLQQRGTPRGEKDGKILHASETGVRVHPQVMQMLNAPRRESTERTGPYLEVKADLRVGAHTRDADVIMGVGKAVNIGVSQEIASLTIRVGTDGATLDVGVLDTNPEASLEAKGGLVGAGGTVSIPVGLEEGGAEGTFQFTLGPIKFVFPTGGENPTMEITIIEESKNLKKGTSAGFEVAIKNIGFLDNEQVTNSFKASYNQWQNHPIFKNLRERQQNQQEKQEENN